MTAQNCFCKTRHYKTLILWKQQKKNYEFTMTTKENEGKEYTFNNWKLR